MTTVLLINFSILRLTAYVIIYVHWTARSTSIMNAEQSFDGSHSFSSTRWWWSRSRCCYLISFASYIFLLYWIIIPLSWCRVRGLYASCVRAEIFWWGILAWRIAIARIMRSISIGSYSLLGIYALRAASLGVDAGLAWLLSIACIVICWAAAC